MKYTVTVAKQTRQVEFARDGVRIDERLVAAWLVRVPGTPLRRLTVGERTYTLAMVRQRGGWSVQLAGDRWAVDVVDERTQQLRDVTGAREFHRDGGIIRAPMPGLVLAIEVEVGQEVRAGQGVVVLEAMKMENEITTSRGGVVLAICVQPRQAVEKGTQLVELAPEEG